MKETYIIEVTRNSTRNLQVYAFDLQKGLHTPFGKNGMLYQYSELVVCNLTSFNLIKKQACCLIWNKTIGKRGASESGLLKLIELYYNTDNMELILFADNCPRQNKNLYIIQMISLAVRKFKNLKSLQLVFLERRQTQSENNSIHSAIEKSKKGITIFEPFQWVTKGIVETLSNIVETMDTDDFLSFETSLDGEYAILVKNLARKIEHEKTKKKSSGVK